MNRFGIALLAVLVLDVFMVPARVGAEPGDRSHQALQARGRNGVVVSVSPEATAAGIEILKAGGNAVDAAIAVGFALAVTFPAAGNLAGGGFMMVYDPQSAQVYTVEYRETAPRAASYERMRGFTARSRGHLSVGVPGTVRGFALAHRRFGSLPWARLLEPAIRLAEEGFQVRAPLARSLNAILQHPEASAEMKRVYGRPDGRPWQAGDRLRLPDLANTLRLLAEHGPDAFYRGPIARLILEEMARGGGLITAEDLAGYRAHIRPPIRVRYRDYEVYGPPPPSSGGIVLGQMLKLVEPYALRKWGRWHPNTLHVMIEAMRRAYLDRARYLGDADFVHVPVRRLLSPGYLKRLSATIDLNRATPSDELGADILTGSESKCTTHFVVADRSGFAVSNTYTLQDSYGSLVVVKGGGFLLNNEMTDFNWTPGRTDRSGNIGTPANRLQPGKRMLSSQTPVIVLRDRKPFLLTGSPGGRTIINTSFQITLGVLEFGMSLRSAVDAPRVHHQWMPDRVLYERAEQLEQLRRALEARGHRLVPVRRIGDAHSAMIDPSSGLFIGEADRRIEGSALAF